MGSSADHSLSSMNDSIMDALKPVVTSDLSRPYVVAQLGQSLDGRIATPTGCSKYISGSGALDFLHQLRASVDAVVVGIGTVLADDPLLNVRRVKGCNPARVIIDPNGRLPENAKCLTEDGTAVYVVRSGRNYDSGRAQVIFLPYEAQTIDPNTIINALFQQGLRRILIEGGSQTISNFITAGAIDRLYVLVAPIILGSGQAGLNLPPIDQLDEAIRPATRIYSLVDGDVLFDCCLKS